MKLSLEKKNGIAVLTIRGEIDPKSLPVLKAGLTKLLRDGKNRIIVNFEDSKTLDSELIRDIALVDLSARELAGQIIISSKEPEIKESLKNFAKPSPIPFFESAEKALLFFEKKKTDDEEGGEGIDELRKEIKTKEREISALKDQIKLLDPAEIKKLREEKMELTNRTLMLMEQVEDFMVRRKAPQDVDGFLAKIDSLEQTVKQLSAEKSK